MSQVVPRDSPTFLYTYSTCWSIYLSMSICESDRCNYSRERQTIRRNEEFLFRFGEREQLALSLKEEESCWKICKSWTEGLFWFVWGKMEINCCKVLKERKEEKRKNESFPPSKANKHVQTHDSIILHDTCLERTIQRAVCSRKWVHRLVSALNWCTIVETCA